MITGKITRLGKDMLCSNKRNRIVLLEVLQSHPKRNAKKQLGSLAEVPKVANPHGQAITHQQATANPGAAVPPVFGAPIIANILGSTLIQVNKYGGRRNIMGSLLL